MKFFRKSQVSKNQAGQQQISNKRKQVYEKLKVWDTKRGTELQKHFNFCNNVLSQLEQRKKSAKQYFKYVESIMLNSILQLERYIQKGVTKSQFVLEKNQIQAYQPHHDVLKALMLEQSQKQLGFQQKLVRLRELYNKFKFLTQHPEKEQKINKKSGSRTSLEAESDPLSANQLQSQGSSVIILKVNVRELISFDLPQTLSKVVELSQKVSSIYNLQLKEDLYLAIQELIQVASQQQAMHKDIGKQLISLCDKFTHRDSLINIKLKDTLAQFLKQENQQSQELKEQLLKKDDNPLIKQFYNIQEIFGNAQFDKKTYSSVWQYLQNFTTDKFDFYQQLILAEIDAIYNTTIQTTLIMTVDGYIHLLRNNQKKPDFSFLLQKGLQIKKINEKCLDITMMKKNFMFKKQIEFNFTIEFLDAEDLQFLLQELQCFDQVSIL